MNGEAKAQVLTANRLADGIVVFLGAEGGWHEAVEALKPITESETFARREALARADEEAERIVDAYAIDVAVTEDGVLRPLSLRETIRAAGPTVRPDLGKQAER